ncbi:hypothetical protein [Lacipirellula sp.]|uniref:hypothetical protein n=1 Tax=Lacipirellula sp. TaxID=2691419 RepID=UPI003D103D9B
MSDFNPERLAHDFPYSGHPRIQYDVSYWPIELESLCDTPTGLAPFTKIFLGSIARRVERSLNLPAQDIHLTVIDMQFVGDPYPCIAAYSDEKDARGFSVISEETAHAILCEVSSTFFKTQLGKMLRQESRGDAEPTPPSVQ